MNAWGLFKPYRKTLFRIVCLGILSVQLVLVIPYAGVKHEEFLTVQILNIGVLYAIIVGFILSITLSRKQALEEHISLELNKIRRVYHLAHSLAMVHPECKKWFLKLKKSLENYLLGFETLSFQYYEKSDVLFRGITNIAYLLPRETTIYDTPLYTSLLDATGDATAAREYIRAKKDNRIGLFLWLVLFIVTITLDVMLISLTPVQWYERTLTCVVIFNIFLVLGLIFEYDLSNEKKGRYISSLYVRDLKKIRNAKIKEYEINWEI